MKLLRFGVTDIVLDEDLASRLPKYVEIKDNDGHLLTEVEIYLIEEDE